MVEVVERPWGSWEEYVNEPGYRVKRLVLRPGQSISDQHHENRSEHWVIVSGTGLAKVGELLREVGPDQSLYIPRLMRHRLQNVGSDLLIVIETQFGECDEDDIYRHEDQYCRPTGYAILKSVVKG